MHCHGDSAKNKIYPGFRMILDSSRGRVNIDSITHYTIGKIEKLPEYFPMRYGYVIRIYMIKYESLRNVYREMLLCQLCLCKVASGN